MTKDVLVSLSGLQMAQEQDPENTEVISKGEYFFRNGKHFVVYDEIMEGINDPSKTKIKFTDNTLEVLRQGEMSVHMIFEKDKKNVTYYYTPFGSLQIGIDTRDIQVVETDELITVEVEYALDANYEYVGDCKIKLAVSPKGSKNFSLTC